jgi:hypothetical protein
MRIIKQIIITMEAMPAALLSPDAEVFEALKMIGQWNQEMLERQPPSLMLCIDCDTEFSARSLPAAFLAMVLLPRGDEGEVRGLVSGICQHCCTRGREGLERMGCKHAKKLWPDSYPATPDGHARH